MTERSSSRPPVAPPAGVWLGASYVLGRPVPVAEPYPHICQMPVVGSMTGVQFTTWRRDCAACQHETHAKKQDGQP